MIFHPENGSNITIYDPKLVNVSDGTKIDGLMQDEQYIAHRKDEIKTWLKIKPEYECYEYSDDNTCVINFRGGEYTRHPEFFLHKKYWHDAVKHMLTINKNFRFIVITDDVFTAKKFFPDYAVFHFSIGKDYSIIKNAHYLILSNSTFAWFPAWTSEVLKFCIAPKYFARHNISDGYWSLGYNITTGWNYMDREGKLSDYNTCIVELKEYEKNNEKYFLPVKIESNFLVVSNYNNDIRWVPEYTDNYVLYDRSDAVEIPALIDSKKVIKTPNIGYNLYDYFTFIIDNYDTLPDCTIFTKGNVFPRHVRKEYFDKIVNNNFFTPIEDYKMHTPYWPTCFFAADGGFCEINNSWYTRHHPTKYFRSYDDFMDFCFKKPPKPRYTRFAPGANYIVPKANILKFPKIFYQNLRIFISHCQLPGEAHIVERALHTLWTCNFELNPKALEQINENFTFPSRNFKTLLKEKTPVKIKNVIKSLINSAKNTINFIKQPVDIFIEKRRKKTWLSKTEAAEYRKKIKIYDVFNFFNELETLEIRLNILNDYVDYFVLVESTLTHSGIPKDLLYQKNKHLFKKFEHKIIHYVIDTPLKDFEDAKKRILDPATSILEKRILTDALASDNIPPGDSNYLRDFYEKESVKKPLIDLSDNDICYISDLDEIWNPEAPIDYSKDDIYKYKQDAYMYYLNNRSNEDWNGWTGTIATKYKNVKNNCVNDLRTAGKTRYTVIRNGGWHFTFQGGAQRIKDKLSSYSYHEINTEETRVQIEKIIKNNKDIKGRYIKFWKDERKLPHYLLENKQKYKELFK